MRKPPPWVTPDPPPRQRFGVRESPLTRRIAKRKSESPLTRRIAKRKSESNLEKAGGYAYGAAKTVGGWLMPDQMEKGRMMRKPPPSYNRPAKRKPFGGTETRPNEREGKRIPPRQRMPKEIENDPRSRPKRPRPPTQHPKPRQTMPNRPYPRRPRRPADLSNKRRRNADWRSSYGS